MFLFRFLLIFFSSFQFCLVHSCQSLPLRTFSFQEAMDLLSSLKEEADKLDQLPSDNEMLDQKMKDFEEKYSRSSFCKVDRNMFSDKENFQLQLKINQMVEHLEALADKHAT